MTRHRTLALLLTACVAVSAAGCVRAAPQPSRAPRVTPEPPASVQATPPADVKTVVPLSPAPGSKIGLKVYYLLGEKVQPAQRAVPATRAVLRAALDQLVAGPTAAERKAGLGTEIPAGTRVRDVSLDAGTATIDLTGAFASGGGTSSMMGRLAQIVYTATQFGGVEAVSLRLDGKPVDVFGGEGIVLDRPQTRADMEYATPAILVDTPAWGGTIKRELVVRGTANVFEGVFQLQVLDAASHVLLQQRVTATSGTGTRGSWSLAPARALPLGPVRIKVWTESPKDGSPQDVIVIPMIVGK